jgi:RNase P/RNase MRP subunit p30
MKKEIIDLVLAKCTTEKIKITYEDEIFGITVLSFKNYTIDTKTDKYFSISEEMGMAVEYNRIIAIDIETSIDKRVELIEQSENLEEALIYTSEEMTPNEQVALEILYEKLLPQMIERNLQTLKQRIMGFTHVFKTIENVLSNLRLNICENGKIATSEQNERLTQISDEEIKNAIKNYEEEIF